MKPGDPIEWMDGSRNRGIVVWADDQSVKISWPGCGTMVYGVSDPRLRAVIPAIDMEACKKAYEHGIGAEATVRAILAAAGVRLPQLVKTPGQIACEGFGDVWERCEEPQRALWELAAEAVITSLSPQVPQSGG